jgi:hypothetical protein
MTLNDLQVTEFGKGYWINVSQNITLRLKGINTTPPKTLPMFQTVLACELLG